MAVADRWSNITAWDDGRCGSCRASRVAVTLSVRSEERTARGSWGNSGTAHSQGRCEPCFAHISVLLTAAGPAAARRPDLLGVPFSKVVLPDDRHCDYCNAELEGPATVLDIIPHRGPEGGTRHRTRQQRLCRLCAAWVRLLLCQPAGERAVRRAPEGPPGGWLSQRTCDVATWALLPRDQETVRVCAEEMGRTAREIRSAEDLEAATSGETLILAGAGKRDRATTLTEALSAKTRRAVAVVARTDQLLDAGMALRMGAGALLASPLTPQQLAGAMDRLLDPEHGNERDPATGLPMAGPPGAHFGMPCQVLRVVPEEGEELLTALLLRRFVRGYDRVFKDADGGLILHLYCPAEALEAIAARLRFVCGEQTVVEQGEEQLRKAA